MKVYRFRKIATAVFALLLPMFAVSELSDGGMYYVKTNDGPGVWINLHYAELKAQADAENIPLIVFWANPGCWYCKQLEEALATEEAYEWQKESGYLFAFGYGTDTADDSQAKTFAKHGSGQFPYLCFYWNKNAAGKTVKTRYSGRSGNMYVKTGSLFAQFTGTAAYHFDGFVPPSRFNGGTFAVQESTGNRYEAESSTRNVAVALVRTAVEATKAAEASLVVKTPSGKSTTIPLSWSVGQTAMTVDVAIAAGTFTRDGQQITLSIVDEDGASQSETHITYVSRAASAANPLWIGETFGFGEWTCDIDAAKAKVAAVDGNAYTLVSIQGSMWCPDCANTDRNFLEVTAGSGKNRFQAWAKSKNIALVSMDIPNYNGPDVSNRATPTLFATNAYSTRLARPTEYPQSGAEGSLTNYVVRSGLGYLTRKGVTGEQAEAQLKKFHDLAYLNTDKGGFHRPEDGNKNRTGVPIFVLLRKDGSVAARFTQFAAVSPMSADQENFDNYIKRFEEMLALAADTGDHADKMEIENNYPGSGAISFAANGGTASNELCNADMQDAFKLVGVGGNADQKVTVKGSTSATVTIQFWKKNSDETYAAVGTYATGKLSDGLDLTCTFTEGGDYYLLVKGADITSSEFDVASETSDNFHPYTVEGHTVLVPQGDQVKANAPANSDTVVIRLEQDQVYCFSGVNAGDNPIFVQTGTLGAYTFLKSTASGDIKVKVATGLGGEISYQIWQPGQIAFAQTGMSVRESVNDLDDDFVEFQVSRVNGKSGRVKARVTVDIENSTLETARYVFATNAPNAAADFTWEDGVTSNMTVRVHIEDDLFYDGDKTLRFNLEILASDAGDVTVADGRGTFELVITEDDKNEPGRGVITRTTPGYGKKGTVYVRESDGAKIWVERIEACGGLVMAELVSSVKDVEYATENPRDLTNGLGRTWIYWSSREQTEKYVQIKGIAAGKTARIQLKSFGNFKTVNGSNTVSIVVVADDAPAFEVETSTLYLNRYVQSSGASVKLDAEKLVGGKVTFSKLSGTLPPGLSAAYDDEAKALVFSGAVTAKPGTYEVTYQVSEMRAGKRVAGLTTAVKFVVSDPTDVKTNPEGANPAVAVTRTFKDLAVVQTGCGIMAGVLQLTIPQRGNVSGKYACESGTISFSTKSWAYFNPTTKALAVVMTGSKDGFKLALTVAATGAIVCVVTDPNYPSIDLDASSDGVFWEKDRNPASDWKGYYTVAVPVESVVTNVTPDLAPTGCGYLTLKMDTSSAYNAGRMAWAGMLPNGTAVSGSATLDSPYGISDDGVRWVNLPVFKANSTDVLSVLLRIKANATIRSVESAAGGSPRWSHGETKTEVADYVVGLGVYGSIYDKTKDLGECCEESASELRFDFKTDGLKWLYAGTPVGISSVRVSLLPNTLKLVQGQDNPSKVTLSLSRSTGVVSGGAYLGYIDEDQVERKQYVSYKGIVLDGWGEGCGCGEQYDVYRPFFNGAFYFSDKVEYSNGKSVRKQSVKRGGAALMEPVGDQQ